MIEAGALLGAMVMTLAWANIAKDEPSDGGTLIIVVFGLAPILGALWGAVVAAAIHFTANGTLPGILLGLVMATLR